jgi:hypothetical protein
MHKSTLVPIVLSPLKYTSKAKADKEEPRESSQNSTNSHDFRKTTLVNHFTKLFVSWLLPGFYFSDLSQFCNTFWTPENEYKGNA